MAKKNCNWIKERPIAHRGLHDGNKERFENTLSAARAALEAGYSIEVDLHPSKDLVPMVFHDEDLGRLTGQQGPFHDHNAVELQTIQIGNTADHVPTLRALLDLVDGKVGLILELKGIAGKDDGLVFAVLEELKAYEGPVAIMSFNHWMLEEARNIGTDIPVGLTAEGDDSTSAAHQAFCAANDIDFVSYGISDLPNQFVEQFRASGKPVITWTVRSQEQAEFSTRYADQITFEGFIPR